jgi:transposase-like protein
VLENKEEGQMMETSGRRRRFTPEEKVSIVLEGLRGETQVSVVCRRHGISTGQFYQWRDTLVRGAKEAFSRRGRPRGNGELERFREELGKKDRVIVEMTEELLKVKRGLWP